MTSMLHSQYMILVLFLCFVVVLTGWQAATRDPITNAPRPDEERFPNGIKFLADRIHDLGLKVRQCNHILLFNTFAI